MMHQSDTTEITLPNTELLSVGGGISIGDAEYEVVGIEGKVVTIKKWHSPEAALVHKRINDCINTLQQIADRL